jgi:hypothetical protein
MLYLTARRALGGALVTTALLVTACGGGAPAAPTTAPKPAEAAKPTEAPKPTTAPAAASPAAASPAGAASPAAGASPAASPSPAAVGPNVNGEVDAVNGRVLSVVTNTGPRTVRVADNATIQIEGQGTTADLMAGRMVAITGKPDGTAVIVRFFPAGITLKPTQFPMTGANAGNIMTNATIDAFDGKTLTVDLGGQKQSITVVPETQIIKPVPSSFDQIKPGVRVITTGTPEGTTLVATSVTISTVR